MGSKKAALILLALLVVTAFWPAFFAGFVYDDPTFIIQNPRLTEPGGLLHIWTRGIPDEHYWPVTYTVLWAIRAIFGEGPAGFHAVNVAIHAANTLMLCLILRRIKVPGAWLAAAIFGVHPVHVESVAWALELKDVLSGLFALTAFWTYLNYLETGRRHWMVSTVLLFTAGMLSKSAILPLPAVLLIYHWWKRRSWTAPELAPIAVLAVVGGAIATADLIAFQAHSAERFGLGPFDRLLVASRSIWFYLSKLAWPVELSPMYARFDVRSATNWICLIAVAAAAVGLGRYAPRGGVAAAAFFVVMLAPTLGFIDFAWMKYAFVADRFQYLASIGPLTIAAAALAWVGSRYGRSAAVRGGAAALLLAGLGLLTWKQSALYANEETFYRGILERNPSSWAAHMNLGVVMMASGRSGDAVSHHLEALALRPDLVEARVNLGAARAAVGLVDEAAADFVEAIRLRPDDPSIHDFLGIMRLRQQRVPEAVAEFREALRLDPEYEGARKNLEVAMEALARIKR
jgi:Flp pilus assembly protein TadD